MQIKFRDTVINRALSSGVTVSAERYGLLKFDFSGWPNAMAATVDPEDAFEQLIRATQERVKVMNAHLLCLHSSGITRENLVRYMRRIDTDDLIHFNDAGDGLGGPGISDLPLGNLSVQDIMRYPLPIETFDHSLTMLDSILTHPFEGTLEIVRLLNEAKASYQDHDYALSIVSAWTVCEALIDKKWRDFLASRRTTVVNGTNVVTINKQRKDKLTGTDYTASVVTEILQLAGEIPFETYKALNAARGARNNWLHDMKPPTGEIVRGAIEVARLMLETVLNLELKIIPTTSVTSAG